MLGDRHPYLQGFRETPTRGTGTPQTARWTLKINLTFHPNYRIILYYQLLNRQALSEEQT